MRTLKPTEDHKDKDEPRKHLLAKLPVNVNLRELYKKVSASGSVILEALGVRSDNIDTQHWSITHHSQHRDSGSLENLNKIQCNDSDSLIIVGGELILSDGQTEKAYPPGYIIQNWNDWKDQSKRQFLKLTEEGVIFLKIPRSDLQDIIKEDPNFSAALIQIMYQVHPKQKFSDTDRELIRSARDEVLQALSTRDAFSLISGEQGIISILNPKKLDLDRGKIRIHKNEVEEEGEYPCSTIEQAWKIVNPISMLLLGDRGVRAVLQKKAREIRDEAENKFKDQNEQGITEEAFKEFRFYLRRKRITAVNNLSVDFHNFCEHFKISDEDRLTLSKRIFQIYWLAKEAKDSSNELLANTEAKIGYLFNSHINRQSNNPTEALKGAKEDLDSIIEPLFNLLQQDKIPGLRGARIRKLERAARIEETRLVKLPADHWVYKNLRDLNRRLVEGDKSAVGGTDYQMRRWPQSLHPFVFDGSLKVVFCDGALGDGIRWIRSNFSLIPGTETYQALTFKILKGEYADFPQCFIAFEHGQKFWLISYDGGGIGRPFSNAMAIRLQAEEKNVENILNEFIFLEQPIPIKERLSDSLTEILELSEVELKSANVFDGEAFSPEQFPTQLIILHHLDGLIEEAGKDVYVQRFSSKSLHEVAVLFWKNEEGQIIRNIIVPVGSKGLYHESAGAMVEAFLTHPKIIKPIKHIYFSAQAGIISHTDKLCEEKGLKGISDVDPGGLVIPQGFIASEVGEERQEYQIRTLFTDSFLGSSNPYARSLVRFISENEVYLTSNHLGVSCPADETEKDLAKKVEASKASSVDVECFFCAKAANLHGARLTVVNYVSDVIPYSPTGEIVARKFDTFAFSGVLQSGSKPDPAQARMALLALRAIQYEELRNG